MRKGITRIALGSILIIFQCLSYIGNAMAGNTISISFSNPALLIYDLVFLISYSIVGIVGAILLISGTVAFRKSEEPSSAVDTNESVYHTKDSESVPVINLENPNTPQQSTVAITAPVKPIKKQQRFCKFCGSSIDPATKKCTGCGKQYFRFPSTADKKFWIVCAILVFVALLASLMYCGILSENNKQLSLTVSQQSSQIRDMKNNISELNNTVSDQNREIESKYIDIARQNTEIERLEPLAENYREICSQMQYGTAGYASANFHTDTGFVIVQKSARLQNETITLTTNWYQRGTVTITYSSDHARLSFTEDSWNTSTALTVIPKSLGVTVATFTNSLNNESFKVLIIVTN